MTDATYNGYANYATWAVALWIDNEQGAQEYWIEQARDAVETEDFDMDSARRTLADQLETEHEEAMPEVMGVFADLLRHAIGSVDWFELADHYLEDIEIYSAGWNLPGYMPDEPPARFFTSEDAREYIADALETHADDQDDGEDAEGMADVIRAGTGEFGATIDGYHYFVTRL